MAITITYPSTETLFAFNRYKVRVEGATAGQLVTTRVHSGSVTYEDRREAGAGGSLDIYFNHYLQLLFSQANILAGRTSLEITMDVGATEETMESWYATCYWGGISAGERLGDRTLRYYPALDNPLPAWQFGNSTVLVQADNNEARQLQKAMTEIIDLRTLFTSDELASGHILHVMQLMAGVRNLSTFDGMFDYTFWAFGKNDVLRTDVVIDCGTSGVYLKWIDPQGVWYYYLFEPYSRTLKTKAVGDDYETFAEGDSVGYYGALRPQGWTAEDTQTAVAPLVSREERRMLQTLLTSPLVFWCPDVEGIASGDYTTETAEWLPVRIVAGSTRDDLEKLADFEITVQYPDRNVQRL